MTLREVLLTGPKIGESVSLLEDSDIFPKRG